MKIAVLADIHANFVALQAVTEHLEAWRPDHVIVAGDIVNRGPRPLECLRFVRQKERTSDWLTVRGNHEDYVIKYAQPDAPRSGPAFEAHLSSYWTCQQLNGDIPALVAMPFSQSLTAPDGSLITITHASMRSNRDGIYPRTTDAELRQIIEPASALFCVGHTHLPLIRWIDGTLVVNTGAVGLPFDGNMQASYAQVQWHAERGGWSAEIIRLNYDYQQAERDFFETGFMTDSGALALLILDEFRTAQSRLFQWTAAYQAGVLAGEVSMEESVRDFMRRIKG